MYSGFFFWTYEFCYWFSPLGYWVALENTLKWYRAKNKTGEDGSTGRIRAAFPPYWLNLSSTLLDDAIWVCADGMKFRAEFAQALAQHLLGVSKPETGTSCSCLKAYAFVSNEQQRFSSSTQGHAQAPTQANTLSCLLERIAWKQWHGFTSIWISLSASAIICQMLYFQVEKEGNTCRASICREQSGVPFQVKPMLRVERDQTVVHPDPRSLHPGRKCWRTSFFLFSNLAGWIWQ